MALNSSARIDSSNLRQRLPLVELHPRAMSEWEKARLEYFQKHALSQYIEHLKFRPLTLQIFLAGEAVLFTAWARSSHPAIAFVGLVACISAWVWDVRTMDLMGEIHRWGQMIADPYFCHPELIGDAIHHKFGPPSGSPRRWWHRWKRWKSHTVALDILILAIAVVWIWILVTGLIRHAPELLL